MIIKNEVRREDLKNNFLKNIIVRFDYTGIAEVELDGIISKVKPIFKENGYNKLQEEYLTEMDFQLQDPEIVEMEGLPIREIRKKKAYVFSNEEKGLKCKLSTCFAFVTVQNQKYISFSEYSKTLINLIKVLKEEVEFLSCFRFGIRKVNQCIIRDISRLNQYFDKKLFGVYGLERGNVLKLWESKDCFEEGQYNINLTRTVVMGEYTDDVVYQVVFDSDIYVVTEENINELLKDSSRIDVMNERLFVLYKEALTETFIEALGQDCYYDENIIGVEKNE